MTGGPSMIICCASSCEDCQCVPSARDPNTAVIVSKGAGIHRNTCKCMPRQFLVIPHTHLPALPAPFKHRRHPPPCLACSLCLTVIGLVFCFTAALHDLPGTRHDKLTFNMYTTFIFRQGSHRGLRTQRSSSGTNTDVHSFIVICHTRVRASM